MIGQQRLKRQLVSAVTARQTRVPEAGRLFWNMFAYLSNARPYNFTGPNPIAISEIYAFARLHRWPIGSHHVELICSMDQAWIEQALKRTGTASTAAPNLNLKNAQALTAEAFDAVF